ncbi:hypothetical protein [Rossellomorea aquimaris]|uniref:hypothetical protein n=1 Tax=Rossellomorea aquimaris TaxID=189382 RepID=UPI001CFCCDE8|nr:hypothetical protein [Rossellomorea aquimaris]
MITEVHLKEKLRTIDFTCPDSIKDWDMDELLKDMVHHIGSIDGELRDSLIYTSFYRLMEGNHLSQEQILLKRANDCPTIHANWLFPSEMERYREQIKRPY